LIMVRFRLLPTVILACLVVACDSRPHGREGGGATAATGVETSAWQPLFDGHSLEGWIPDVPRADKDPDLPPSFIVRDGRLVSLGTPRGHLVSERSFSDYRLVLEYRFAGEPGNCGVLVHVSRLRLRNNMFPQSLEVQMMHGDAGDFWCIGEDIVVEDMERRRPRADGQKWGASGNDARRILNLTDGSEKPPGEWNRMEILCRGDRIRVWLNGELVNDGHGCTASSGRIALQAEGSEVEFRRIEWMPDGGGEAGPCAAQ